MTTFLWAPFYDSAWNRELGNLGYGGGNKILPHADGSKGYVGHENVSWSQIQANDTLVLAAHGKKWSTNEVAWRGQNGVITQWSPAVFAQAIRACLGDNFGLQISYRLLACFGANNITPLAPSFGSKLAAEMSNVGLRGTLTAYKGATGMDSNSGMQTGSSRITCALSLLRHQGTLVGTHRTDTASVVWQLPA